MSKYFLPFSFLKKSLFCSRAKRVKKDFSLRVFFFFFRLKQDEHFFLNQHDFLVALNFSFRPAKLCREQSCERPNFVSFGTKVQEKKGKEKEKKKLI